MIISNMYRLKDIRNLSDFYNKTMVPVGIGGFITGLYLGYTDIGNKIEQSNPDYPKISRFLGCIHGSIVVTTLSLSWPVFIPIYTLCEFKNYILFDIKKDIDEYKLKEKENLLNTLKIFFIKNAK